MSKPDFSQAVVGRKKLLDYLLSPIHPTGRSKARFFQQAGFDRDAWKLLEVALIDLADSNAVVNEAHSEFGVKYTIDGVLNTPSEMRPRLRTVWIVDLDSTQPRLVTAHPL